MKITFILPLVMNTPVGGFRVVYEYATRLSMRGHIVTVVHRRNRPLRDRKRFLREAILPWTKKAEMNVSWFPMPPEVTMTVVMEVCGKTVPDADAIIATAWQTAILVSRLSARKGKKYYLVQHDESSFDPPDIDNATWHLPLHKIVIAKWLGNVAKRLGEDATHIPNGMELTKFLLKTPLDARPPRVGMLYHQTFDWKGSADGLQALLLVKAEHQNLEVSLFGTDARPVDLPDWINYQQLPSPEELCALYNSCAIFVQPSWTEGWGLTATEAMACGCALVTTDNGGSDDYAEEGVTALVAPSRQPTELARQIGRLLSNDALRQSLAQAGHSSVQQYNWTVAVDKFEQLLLDQMETP